MTIAIIHLYVIEYNVLNSFLMMEQEQDLLAYPAFVWGVFNYTPFD